MIKYVNEIELRNISCAFCSAYIKKQNSPKAILRVFIKIKRIDLLLLGFIIKLAMFDAISEIDNETYKHPYYQT